MRAGRSIISLVAFCWAGQVYAQEGVAASATASPSAEAGGDIVVTAQRRSERLVDVPISVATVSSEALETSRGDSLSTLTRLVPGVTITQNSFVQPAIRGITTTASGVGIDSPVAIYVDGVYQADQTGLQFDLANIEGIEVLKGPQGTLFGRNATGGAILIKTRDPSFTRSARATFSYASFNEVRANGYVNLPISDTLAINGAVSYRHSDGWTRDILTGNRVNPERNFDVRGKLLWAPSDKVEVILSAAHYEVLRPVVSGVLNGNTIGNFFGLPYAEGPKESGTDVDSFLRDNSEEYSARLKLDLDIGTITTISAYHNDRSRVLVDIDGSYAPFGATDLFQRNDTISQELNFTSPANKPLTFVAGVYYYRQVAKYPTLLVQGAPFINSRQTTNAYAAYIDGTYEFGDLSVIAGARYSIEDRRLQTGLGAGPFTYKPERRFKAFTPRAGLRYAVGPRTNIYGTYSRGFKSGQFDPADLTNPGVEPENVDAFEVGFKTAGPALSFNLAGYYYKYKNIQLTSLDFSTGLVKLFNAARAEIYGAEADATWKISDSLDVRLAAAYTHGRYKQFANAPVFTPTVVPGVGAVGNVQSFANGSGNKMVRAPGLTLSGAITYRLPIGDDRLELSAIPYYSSRVYYSFDNRISQPSFFTLDGSISYIMDSGVKLSVFAQNLTNKAYLVAGGSSNLGDSGTYGKPRSIGASIGFTY